MSLYHPSPRRLSNRARSALLATLGVAALLLTGCTDGSDEPEEEPAAGAGGVEDVVIPADGLDLTGTLRLPDADGEVPAVVIVHGSGPHGRDGELPGQLGLTLPEPVAVYRELAEHLQAAGFAALTWDKRTCGGFNDCAENDYPAPANDLAFEDMQGDVNAVLDFLGDHEQIGEVVLAGHSKGGTYGAGVVAERDDVAGLFLLAAPAVPINDVMHFQAQQFAALLTEVGDDSEQSAQVADELQDLADEVDAVADGDLDGPPVGGASREFWASWIDASHRAPEQVAEADVPVLALGGEYDWNVPPEHVEAWEPYLDADDRVEILPNITHALTYLGTDDANALGPQDLGTEVDPSVTETLVTWLEETLQR